MPLIVTAPKSIYDQTELESRVAKSEAEIAVHSGEIAMKVTETEVTSMLAAADGKIIRTSAVTIDANGIALESTGTIGLKSGGAMRLDSGADISVSVDGDAKLTIDDQGLSADVVRAESVSAPNLILKQTGGTIPWRGSLQATLDSMGKYLDGECTITAQADDNGLTGDTGEVVISGFIGGIMNIILTGVTLAYPICIINTGSVINIKGEESNLGNIAPQTGGDYAVRIVKSIVHFRCIRITGAPRASASTGTWRGVYATDGATVSFWACTIERTYGYAICAEYGCVLSVDSCRGGLAGGTYDSVANLGTSIHQNYSCALGLYGTMPSAATGVSSWMSAVYGTASQLDSEGVVPVVTTQTVTYACSAYGRLVLPGDSTSIGSTYWQSGIEPRQGATSSSDYYGCWILGNADSIQSALYGKTINGITLKLGRSAGMGNSSALNIQLWAHGWSSMPTSGSGANPVGYYAKIGKIVTPFNPYETRTLNLSSELAAAEYSALKTGLQNGSIKGFGLYGGYGSGRRPYLQMTGVCELTVTYTG